jgi:uncharacterized oligopeptide transporter (OPT) family protein
MLASVLRLQKALRFTLEEKAHEAVDDAKGMVVRVVVVAALAVAAAIFALLALITGLLDLYEWMEPTYGIFLALSIVGGVLAVIALVLISAAMILSRGRPGSEKVATPKTIEVPSSPVPLSVTPAPVDSVVSPASATSAATAGDMIEPFLSVVKRYAQIPRTGSAPVDDFIRQMEPRVELATKEAVTRASTLVQTGDRATMLAVLGAAMAFGWLLVKIAKPSDSNRASQRKQP